MIRGIVILNRRAESRNDFGLQANTWQKGHLTGFTRGRLRPERTRGKIDGIHTRRSQSKGIFRKFDREGSSLAHLAFEMDLSPVKLNNFLNQG